MGTWRIFFVIFCLLFGQNYVEASYPFDTLSLEECLLPKDHPVYKQVRDLFKNPNMFESQKSWAAEGFHVFKKTSRGLLVAEHPSIDKYLFKKYSNRYVQSKQTANYIRRITGAKALQQFIKKEHLKRIVVPKKWLIPLPKEFASEQSYILIVEKIDLISGKENSREDNAQKYFEIDKKTLKELCLVVFNFRGLDSVLSNMPFTNDNKIAFIDTDRWERYHQGYLRFAKNYLTEENKAYAASIFEELKENKK